MMMMMMMIPTTMMTMTMTPTKTMMNRITGRCMKEKADPGFNFGAAKQYAHAGVRAEHLDDTASSPPRFPALACRSQSHFCPSVSVLSS